MFRLPMLFRIASLIVLSAYDIMRAVFVIVISS